LVADFKSLENLKNAKEFLTEWINNNPSQIDSLYNTICKKLGFICFAPENTDEIGIMFIILPKIRTTG